MKKDIYNGKVKKEFIGFMNSSIIFLSAIFLAFAIMCLCMALFYENITDDSFRVGLCVFSGIGFALAIFQPLVTVLCIRSYPKHKTLTHLLVREYVLKNPADVGKEEPNEEQSTDNDEQ